MAVSIQDQCSAIKLKIVEIVGEHLSNFSSTTFSTKEVWPLNQAWGIFFIDSPS